MEISSIRREAKARLHQRWYSHAIPRGNRDRKSTRLNSSHLVISYAVFCLKKNNNYEPLSEVDDVSAVTPRLLHHAIERTCLATGRPVVEEKPMWSTLQQAPNLTAATSHTC